MSNHSSTPPISVPPSSSRQRRASIASGLSFPEYKSGNQGLTGPSTGPMANAMANVQSNQRRRLSITTLGLSGSPTQTLQFGNRNFRQGSTSSSVGSSPGNPEEAIVEDENSPPGGMPTSPFARRLSFGAQALRDARAGSIGNGRYHLSPPVSPPAAGKRRTASCAGVSRPSINNGVSGTSSASTYKGLPQNDISNKSWRPIGEGFNWSEALRARAERGPISPNSAQVQQAQQAQHRRSASIASMDQPAREITKQPKQSNKPDFFQEKILRGDFMD
ncbi:uncharacterized protein DSM5745_00559 [Aspergillus mulundensis]|uniref:Uncharacterized protein n=1 Tax=Aspergillus mulundensis TaxID=1810919 RepID=A0A3D8T3V4_9EURO|nr:Uncharacterized protein DSM5745_00559 [Aspergillus mulundensis]RDW93237.1 Uncharacterized protein DSM5745_00559 [Aspergillus mulundensis]